MIEPVHGFARATARSKTANTSGKIFRPWPEETPSFAPHHMAVFPVVCKNRLPSRNSYGCIEAERSIMDVWETDISACIGGIYEAAYCPAAWPVAVESLRRLFHGSTACLARTGPDLRPSDAIAPNNDPVFQHRYINEFADEQNVVEAALARAPVGLVYNDIAYIGPKKLRDSRLWNDWMAPQDMYGGLTSKLLASGQSSWSFDVQRGRRQSEFDDRDVKFLELLSPHLRRAIEINRQNRDGGIALLDFIAFAFRNRARRCIPAHPQPQRGRGVASIGMSWRPLSKDGPVRRRRSSQGGGIAAPRRGSLLVARWRRSRFGRGFPDPSKALRRRRADTGDFGQAADRLRSARHFSAALRRHHPSQDFVRIARGLCRGYPPRFRSDPQGSRSCGEPRRRPCLERNSPRYGHKISARRARISIGFSVRPKPGSKVSSWPY